MTPCQPHRPRKKTVKTKPKKTAEKEEAKRNPDSQSSVDEMTVTMTSDAPAKPALKHQLLRNLQLPARRNS
ncbi:hypothetical protein SKAU_G00298200 [Synaphobranchus kaupii]|uniref:Uncharacterized protein n=1 Tax=Synaphobranchus kaupii TaxID=118154 RepID=A0A9Q1IM15_SYNKA|nr:hypothetical protein SKAU_G00298200 [Synaphobranchus kaupii]